MATVDEIEQDNPKAKKLRKHVNDLQDLREDMIANLGYTDTDPTIRSLNDVINKLHLSWNIEVGLY